ncbi:MAG: outer membrane protein transport protein [Gammaproteobacteria bacterium]|nr:outer membrane protein transport protein [Gammaproteobacteria bacterium]
MNTSIYKTGFKKTILATACVVALSVPFAAQATNGYFAHGYGIKAKGMAGAGVALPQDTLAAATNPAGMVHMGNRMDVGLEIFQPDRSAYTAWPIGNERWVEANEAGPFFIPEFGYNRVLNDKMSVGVSVFGNGGMNTEYSESVFGGAGGAKSGVDLAQLFIAPTFSMKIDDQNSVGISLNLAYQKFKAYGISMFAGFTPSGTTANLSDLDYDTSTGVGVRVGWLGKFDGVTVGATYQSRTRMSKFDKYSELFAEQGDFDIPANFAVGVSFQATPETTVALDVERINYSDVAAIANPNNGWLGGQLGNDDGPGFGWEDMTIVKLGITYQYNKDLVMRAGWNHGGQPIPEGETLFNVLAPATVEDHLTLGATWTLANGAELSGYYMHAFEEQVNGDSPGAGGMSDPGHSNIKMSQNAVGIAYGWEF